MTHLLKMCIIWCHNPFQDIGTWLEGGGGPENKASFHFGEFVFVFFNNDKIPPRFAKKVNKMIKWGLYTCYDVNKGQICVDGCDDYKVVVMMMIVRI